MGNILKNRNLTICLESCSRIFFIVWTPLWYIPGFESTAYLNLIKLQYVIPWHSLAGANKNRATLAEAVLEMLYMKLEKK